MDRKITIDPDALDGSVANLQAHAKSIAAALDALDNEVIRLRGQWSGEAQRAYDQVQAQETHALRAMNALLQYIGQTTGGIAERHRATSKKVAQRWGAG